MPTEEEIQAEERRRIDKRRRQVVDEQATDAWYVTLIGSLGGIMGFRGPASQYARALARRRNAKRVNATCSECGAGVSTSWQHCPHCGVELTGISYR